MEINIKMEDCKFFVDEEKRTVVCVIENTENLVRDFFNIDYAIWDDFPGRSITFVPKGKIYGKMKMPARFTGKAVCSVDDEWNEEAGRLIAFDRAKYKLATSFFKRAQEYVTEIDVAFNELVSSVNEYGERIDNGANKRLEHIKRIAPNFEETSYEN